MFGRKTLARSRYTALRLFLLIILSASTFSGLYYWNIVRPMTLQTLKKAGYLENFEPWERSAAVMSHNEGDEDEDDDDLVPDGVTLAPGTVTTLGFDVEAQIAQDTLQFSQELQSMGFDSMDENRHIGVERAENQEWEDQLMDLNDGADDDSLGLVEDDHIPGLVDDVRPQAEDRRHHGDESKHNSLMEEELEAVARLAEEDAMKDAEDQEWAKLGDVQEAEEWKKEANVDWEEEEATIDHDMDEEEDKMKKEKRKKQKKKKKKQKNKQTSYIDDEEEDDEEDEDEDDDWDDVTSSTVTYETTTFEPTTFEPDEELAREEEEEEEIFNAPETRLIGRLLLKLGLDGRNRRFRTALETHASKDKTIMLTLSDSRYTMLVLNFYESTVLKLGIENVLFGSLDGRLCAKLDTLRIPCFIYARESITGNDIQGGIRKIFNRKVYYRSRMILEAIAMGYTVLYSDVDTMYIRDPFEEIAEMCDECDVGFQQYSSLSRKLSWGVNYVRPTIGSLYLYYSIARKSYNRSTISIPDRFINRLDREGKLNIVRLPHKKCRSGIEFFDNYKFGWDNRCRGCVSIHSDETYSKEAKIYRMKELLFWNLNFDKYYSDRNRKYIQYDNPYIFHNATETLIMEMRALRNALALGQILRRIVVLPRFHCFVPIPREGEEEPEIPPSKWCNLDDVLRVEPFHRWFMGRYREHSFLSHPKVPRIVKKNVSEVYYIGQKIPQDPGPDGETVIAANVTLVRPKSPLYGAQSEEIRVLFEQEPAPVLRFHSLYYGFSHFLSDDIAKSFNRRLKLGFDFQRRVHYSVRKLKVKRPVKTGTQPGHSLPGHPPHNSPVHNAMHYQVPVPQNVIRHDLNEEMNIEDHSQTREQDTEISDSPDYSHNQDMFVMPAPATGTMAPSADEDYR